MTLPRSTPSAQGVDATGILAFVDAAERDDLGLHSLMVVRHGHVVAEGWWRPYAAGRAHLAYSLSKTVTATAVGFLVQEGRLSLDDRVLDHFPELDRNVVAAGWDEVQIRHCLSMTVGHEQDAWPQVFDRMSGSDFDDAADPSDWVPRVFATKPTRPPGTVFAYNQVATYLLAVIVRRLTGVGVAEVLRPRLLTPMGLPDIPWHRDPLGRELGFTGSHLTTEAIASLAQLYLDGGRWEGRQLLSEAWVEEATRAFGPLNDDPERRRGLAPGLRLLVLDAALRLPGRRCLRPVPHRPPRPRHRRGDHGRAVAHAVDARRALGAPRARSRRGRVRARLRPRAGRATRRSRDPGRVGDALGPEYAEFTRSDASDLAADYTAVSVTRDGRRARARAEPARRVAAGARRPGTVARGRDGRRGSDVAGRLQRRLGRRRHLPRRGHRHRVTAPLPHRGAPAQLGRRPDVADGPAHRQRPAVARDTLVGRLTGLAAPA